MQTRTWPFILSIQIAHQLSYGYVSVRTAKGLNKLARKVDNKIKSYYFEVRSFHDKLLIAWPHWQNSSRGSLEGVACNVARTYVSKRKFTKCKGAKNSFLGWNLLK